MPCPDCLKEVSGSDSCCLVTMYTFHPGPLPSLEQLDDGVADASFKRWATSSRVTRQSQWRQYLSFCELYNLQVLPTSLTTVCRYAVYLAIHKRIQFSSIREYVGALKFLNLDYGFPDPDFKNFYLFESVMIGIKRSLGNASAPKEPLTPNNLLSMKYHLVLSKPLDSAIFSCLLIGFILFLRKSNLVVESLAKFDPERTLSRASFTFYSWGMTVALFKTKIIQFREKMLLLPMIRVPNSHLCPVSAVENHFKVMPGLLSDPAFLVEPGRPLILQKTVRMFESSRHGNRAEVK